MFVVLFIILPLIVIVAWVATRDVAPDIPDNAPNGALQNGFDQEASGSVPEASPTSTQTQHNGDNSADIIVFDPDTGVLTFLFAPESQANLERSTIEKIGELLSSPENTEDKIISVEIPQLSDDDTALLTDAIIDAFESLEVPLSVIIFNIYQPDPSITEFEITISFG